MLYMDVQKRTQSVCRNVPTETVGTRKSLARANEEQVAFVQSPILVVKCSLYDVFAVAGSNYSSFSPLRRFCQGLLVKSILKAGSNVSTSVPATFARV
jgi:hypothetical protein